MKEVEEFQQRRRTEEPQTEERIEKGHSEAKKEYLERICDEIMKFQRTGRDLIYRRKGTG
jgi:hypothetical protein